jgi:hypothetical protein
VMKIIPTPGQDRNSQKKKRAGMFSTPSRFRSRTRGPAFSLTCYNKYDTAFFPLLSRKMNDHLAGRYCRRSNEGFFRSPKPA